MLPVFSMMIQAADYLPAKRCSGSSFVQTCVLADGGRYTERSLGQGRQVRDGTDADGTQWTETEIQRFDGSRTTGHNNHGLTWAYSYSSKFGTHGTNRQGKAFFIPPSKKESQADDGNTEAR